MQIGDIEKRTWARWQFDFSVHDVMLLLNSYDSQRKREQGRRSTGHEVLLRSGIMLVVTAWETFVEDTITEQIKARLDGTSDPRDLLTDFQSCSNILA